MVPAENLLVPFDFKHQAFKYSAFDQLVKVYPNPFKRELIIESRTKNYVSEVEIYTMLGEKVVVRADNEDGRRIFMNVDYSDPEAEPPVDHGVRVTARP